MKKYSNRSGWDSKSKKPMGETVIKHKYDYENAKRTSGMAFEDKKTGKNLVEYNQHCMGRPGRR